MLPGAHRLSRGRRGRWEIYWYAWRGRGAPAIWQCVANTEAEALELERAHSREIAGAYSHAAHPGRAPGFVGSLISDFRGSKEWQALAPRTQALWGKHLDAIDSVFGTTSLQAIQAKGTRKLIRKWHEGMSATPRKANTALTVLVRLFEHGIETEDLARNPAAGMARLDEGEGRAGIVWSEEEVKAVFWCASPQVARAWWLAWLTGLRREDLIRLTWSEIDLEQGFIRRPTLKSRRKKRLAIIPIDAGLRATLATFPRCAVQVVTTEAGAAYKSPDSFSSALRKAQARAQKILKVNRPKHLHDLRGTRASILFAAGYSDAQAETWFGWAPGAGGKMRGIYGDPETIARGAVKQRAQA